MRGRLRPATMLETTNLTIRFGGHVAVDHVSCAFAPGTLTAIVGPNGAGKTTYFNLISGQLPRERRPGAAGRRGHHRAARAAAHAPRPGPRVPADAAVPQPHGAGERAAGGAGAPAAAGLRPAGACGSTARHWIDEARAILERVRLADKADVARQRAAARRPAQARGGDADGAGPEGLHVRRADRRHERRRGAGDPRPDPRAQGRARPDRSCWSSTRWTWCASWPTASSCCTTASWWPTASRRR